MELLQLDTEYFSPNPITSNILTGEKLKAFPLGSDTRQGYTFSLLICNIELKVLANEIRKEREIKGTQFEEGKQNFHIQR